MKYKAVIFDLDGTLLNTIEDLANSMNAVLAREGFPTHDVEAYKYFVGNGMRNLVKRALPEDCRSEEQVDRYLEAMKQEYSLRWDEKTQPYEGIPELLDRLKEMGIKTAVLSNKPHEFTKLTISRILSRWEFDAVLGERPSVPRKPDPAGALEIVRLLGLSPDEFLYVGDTGTDMETACAAGIYAVGALWGFRKADELLAAGAKKLIAVPGELLGLF